MLRGGCLALALLGCCSTAWAQSTISSGLPLLGSEFSAATLSDLPATNNPFAVLETVQPEAISDRFSSNGLNVGAAPRLGGFLNSWTQTQIRIGDVTITDPRAGGTPLLLPILPFWERLSATTGAFGIHDNAPGLSMTLDPLRPGTKWFRAFEGSLSAPWLVSGQSGTVPAVDRVDQLQDAAGSISGPLTDRLGLVAAGSWRGLSHVAAPDTAAASDSAASGFAHLVFVATPRDELRALGWVQRATTAAVADVGVHLQSTWERRGTAQAGWRVFGGYTARSRSAPLPAMLVVDSLLSDPVSDLIDQGAGSARRWVAGTHVTPSRPRLPRFGAELGGASAAVDPSGLTRVGELVDGVAARLWTFHAGTGADNRHLTSAAAYANEHLTKGRVTLTQCAARHRVGGDRSRHLGHRLWRGP